MCISVKKTFLSQQLQASMQDVQYMQLVIISSNFFLGGGGTYSYCEKILGGTCPLCPSGSSASVVNYLLC